MYTCGPWDFGPGSEADRRQRAKQRQKDADRIAELQDLLGKVGKAAIAWRSAEVHLGAIDLGIREDDRGSGVRHLGQSSGVAPDRH